MLNSRARAMLSHSLPAGENFQSWQTLYGHPPPGGDWVSENQNFTSILYGPAASVP